MLSLLDSYYIVAVEENAAEIGLLREAVRQCSCPVRLDVCSQGPEAWALLRQRAHEQRLPDLILLDLSLPEGSGPQLLSDLKQDRGLRHVPIAVLANPQAREEVGAAYALQANFCVKKPVAQDEYVRLMRGIEQFWLKRVQLPSRHLRS